MPEYQRLMLVLYILWGMFVFAFGACFGSLINVLVYRMPRGLNVVLPPSRCPACETLLTWRENIPVLGWILLRGRCRFCKSKISARYPIVEAFVGVLFLVVFVLWYCVPDKSLQLHWGTLGTDYWSWSATRPDFMLNDAWVTWPFFVLVLFLLGLLVAMTLIDAETFTIPLALPWTATVLAVLIHPIHAAWVEFGTPLKRPSFPAPHTDWTWAIATPHSWWTVGASVGAVLGLGISLLLVRTGLIRRSFADYEEWEVQHRAAQRAESDAADTPAAEAAAPTPAVTTQISSSEPAQAPGTTDGNLMDGDTAAGNPEMWIMYPHARREMVLELAFLCMPVLCGMGGGWLAAKLWASNPEIGKVGVQPHLWLQVLSGVLLGYLVGGAVVWGVRIFGSLAFGKEAMGLGDVHLMAAVGACLGWIDTVLAFFLAAFVGIAWLLMGVLAGLMRGAGKGGRVQRQLPYGPYLAVATLLVILLKPFIELGLTLLLRVPTTEPPINIP